MHTGRCECGRITYKVNSQIEPPAACHCSQCRRTSGHYWAAGSVPEKDVEISGDTLRWYVSSDIAKRGFCGNCGSSLFFKFNDSDKLDVGLGTLDSPTGLRLIRHIYAPDKGDYYDIADGLPQFETH